MTYAARVILDSIGPNGARLTTFELTMPRIVLAEFNTHRMFSRNSASSRAIPVEKMLARVKEHPFAPTYWGKNQKGMQADEELPMHLQADAYQVWIDASQNAIASAMRLQEIGVHKQLTNRLLEPFMWHVVVFTATELSNFIALRNSKMAAPEIAEPARLLVEAHEASDPMKLEAGEWHLPFVTNYELFLNGESYDSRTDSLSGEVKEHRNPRMWMHGPSDGPTEEHALNNARKFTKLSDIDWESWAKVSAARCARTSYLTHENKRDIAEDATLYEKLVTSGHMSPLEHPAKALTEAEWNWNVQNAANGWSRRAIPVGNFWGWEQFRKTLKSEHDFSGLSQ